MTESITKDLRIKLSLIPMASSVIWDIVAANAETYPMAASKIVNIYLVIVFFILINCANLVKNWLSFAINSLKNLANCKKIKKSGEKTPLLMSRIGLCYLFSSILASTVSVVWGTILKRSFGISLPVFLQMP